MPVATYAVYCDLNNDGDFLDANENITAYVRIDKPLRIQVGMVQPFERMGRSNTLSFYLNNETRIFSPEHASALTGFVKGARIKVTMTYSATTVTRYIGRISKITPSVGSHRDRLTKVECSGLLQALMKTDVSIAAQENVRTDEMILSVLRNSRVVPSNYSRGLVGIPGRAEVGSTAVVGDVGNNCSFDAGIQSFEMVGDNWPAQISVYNAIKRLTEAEWGRFYEGPDGTLYFWNRHRLYEDMANAVDATITDSSAREMPYEYGGDLVRDVVVSAHVRKIDNSVQILAAQDGTPLFNGRTAAINKGHGWTKLELKLRSTAGISIGARSLVQPVPFVDYRAYSDYRLRQGRSDAEITSLVSIRADIIPGGVRWTIVSAFAGGGLLYKGRGSIESGATQRGTRIIDYGVDTRRAVNTDEFSQNEGESVKIDIAGGTLEEAQHLADGILFERDTSAGAIGSIEFYANSSNALMVHARDRAIGDRIATSETQTGHSGEYYIIGRIDTLQRKYHYVEFLTEPAPPSVALAGKVGFCEVGSTAIAGF